MNEARTKATVTILTALIKAATWSLMAWLLYNAYVIQIDQEKRETIARVVISGKDPIRVVCAVDGDKLASRKMCIQVASEGRPD